MSPLEKDSAAIAAEITKQHGVLGGIKKEIVLAHEELEKIKSLKNPIVKDFDDKIKSKSDEILKLDKEHEAKVKGFTEEIESLRKQSEDASIEAKNCFEKKESNQRLSKESEERLVNVSALCSSKEVELRELQKKHDTEIKEKSSQINSLLLTAESLHKVVESYEASEKDYEKKYAHLGNKEKDLFERERVMKLKEAITDEMFAEQKEKYKKRHGV